MEFLRAQGYTELYLLGFSTGANKVCVYNYYKPKNKIAKYILACGGDDSGVFYTELGKKGFLSLLRSAQRKVQRGQGAELVPGGVIGSIYSYQSVFDTLNPDGDYNTFPYVDYFGKLGLSQKKLFRHYASIKKPTLVIYGENDEFCYGRVPDILRVLDEQAHKSSSHEFVSIPGADHGFTGKEKQLFASIIKFLDK